MGIEKAKIEVQRLQDSGQCVDIVHVGDQPYVLAGAIVAPMPPWDRSTYDVLFTLPLAYDEGVALDAFYIRLPCSWNSQVHNRINGGTLEYDGSTWQLVSWHYADKTPYSLSGNAIAEHIVHCTAFFSGRGATNAKE